MQFSERKSKYNPGFLADRGYRLGSIRSGPKTCSRAEPFKLVDFDDRKHFLLGQKKPCVKPPATIPKLTFIIGSKFDGADVASGV